MIGIDIAVIALYLVGMIAIAIYTRNKVKTVKDYLLAGSKGLNGWMSAFAYGTTYFSAVIFIGYAGKFGFSFGLAAVWIGIGNALIGALLAWKVLARRTKNMTVRLDAKTMPDFFYKRYGDEKMKLVSAIVIFIFLIPYAASVYNGLGNLFSIVFDVDGWIIMIVLAVVTAFYLFLGGYIATSMTDFVQGIIMFVGVTIMVFFFLAAPEVKWGEGIKTLADHEMGLFVGGSSSQNFLYDRPMSLIFLILLTSFGVWALPQTIHKYYTVRDKKAIRQGTIVSTVFALVIGFGAYFIGGLATLFFPDGAPGGNTDNVIPHMIKGTLPSGLLGLIAVLVLAASMSTLASVSLASSSVVTIDIYKGTIDKGASDKKVTTTMRVLSLVFVAIATVIAYLNSKFNVTAIAYMMGLSWGTLAGCFMGPYVLGVVWKKTTRTAAWTSIIGSLILTVALIIIIGYDKTGWGAASFGKAVQAGVGSSPMIGVICMIYSMLSTFLVSLFTKPLPETQIKEAFEKEIPNEIC